MCLNCISSAFRSFLHDQYGLAFSPGVNHKRSKALLWAEANRMRCSPDSFRQHVLSKRTAAVQYRRSNWCQAVLLFNVMPLPLLPAAAIRLSHGADSWLFFPFLMKTVSKCCIRFLRAEGSAKQRGKQPGKTVWIGQNKAYMHNSAGTRDCISDLFWWIRLLIRHETQHSSFNETDGIRPEINSIQKKRYRKADGEKAEAQMHPAESAVLIQNRLSAEGSFCTLFQGLFFLYSCLKMAFLDCCRDE